MKLRVSDLKLARSSRNMDRRYWRRQTHDELLATGLADARAMGLRVYVRPKTRLRISSAATAWRRSLALPWDWARRRVSSKAILITHEMVHPRQRRTYKWFLAWYLDPRKRWALEMQAERQRLRGYLAVGRSRAWVRRWIDQRAKRITTSSLYGRMRRIRGVERATRSMLRWELDRT